MQQKKSYLESFKQNNFESKTAEQFIRIKSEKGEEIFLRAFNNPKKKVSVNLSKVYKNGWYVVEPKGWELVSTEEIKKPPFRAKKMTSLPNSIEIQINPNLRASTPARIFPNKKLIEVSPNFFKLKIYQQKFILLHEAAHFFNVDEADTDRQALYWFIFDYGFNFSQAIDTLKNVLKESPEKIKRIENVYKNSLKK